MEGKKECVVGYYRIIKAKDPNAVHRALQKGYGIKEAVRGANYIASAVVSKKGAGLTDAQFREAVRKIE